MEVIKFQDPSFNRESFIYWKSVDLTRISILHKTQIVLACIYTIKFNNLRNVLTWQEVTYQPIAVSKEIYVVLCFWGVLEFVFFAFFAFFSLTKFYAFFVVCQNVCANKIIIQW